MGKIQKFGDNSEIEHVGRISKKCFAIFDVSQFFTLVARGSIKSENLGFNS